MEALAIVGVPLVIWAIASPSSMHRTLTAWRGAAGGSTPASDPADAAWGAGALAVLAIALVLALAAASTR